jgi:hypothetical protein
MRTCTRDEREFGLKFRFRRAFHWQKNGASKSCIYAPFVRSRRAICIWGMSVSRRWPASLLIGPYLALSSLSPKAQTAAERTALSQTVSIGDVIHAEDQKATRTVVDAVSGPGNGSSTRVVTTNASPIHIIYVHGINEVGPDDSGKLRKAICRYVGECDVWAEPKRMYADGPFGLKTKGTHIYISAAADMGLAGRMECIGTVHPTLPNIR